MRLLIDLTDLERWSGHHGGIQRVVYGITKYYYLNSKTDTRIEYISYHEGDKKFIHTDFKPIYDRVEALKNPQKHTPTERVSLKVRARLGIRQYVPKSVRKNKFARGGFKAALKTAKKAVNTPRKIINPSARKNNSHTTVHFSNDDTLLVMGKPWDNLEIIQLLSEMRGQHGFKLVQVVYDMIISLYPHLHHPSLFTRYTQHMFNTVVNSDLLLPISKSSDRDLSRFCEMLLLTKPTSKVIRLGDDIVESGLAKLEKPDVRVEDKYVLCVGTIEIRKNHQLLYSAYKLAEARGESLPQLVIVGAKGWLSSDAQYLMKHDPGVKDRILLFNNISDPGLDWLYKNCLFTVYPSMYEGWGLPIAESLKYGKMCISSNTSSMPEIAGDLIDYFSPYSSQECLEKILKYTDSNNLEQKEKAIKTTYRTHTWEQTQLQVQNYIEANLLNSNAKPS